MVYVRVYESTKDFANGFSKDYIVRSMDDLSSIDFVLIDRIIPFHVSGTTYEERKESLRNLAIDFQSSCQGGLSYGELAMAEGFFRHNGKRYGLLKEFEENYIC